MGIGNRGLLSLSAPCIGGVALLLLFSVSCHEQPEVSLENRHTRRPAVIDKRGKILEAVPSDWARPPDEQAIWDLVLEDRIEPYKESRVLTCLPFSEGLAPVAVTVEPLGGIETFFAEGSWGFVDEDGRWIIEPRFADAGCFSSGLAPVLVERPTSPATTTHQGTPAAWGYIDKKGSLVIPAVFADAHEFFGNYAPACGPDSGGQGHVTGFIDRSGRFQIILPKVVSIGKYSEGLIPVWVTGLFGVKCGYVDRQGTVRIGPRYEEAWPFSDGLAAVEVGAKWGFIDHQGDMVIKPQFILPGDFVNGVATVMVPVE